MDDGSGRYTAEAIAVHDQKVRCREQDDGRENRNRVD